MTGKIITTRLGGGSIAIDGPGRATLISFRWSDCHPSITPSTVGHGTAVELYIASVGGRDMAVNVRRQCEPAPKGYTHA